MELKDKIEVDDKRFHSSPDDSKWLNPNEQGHQLCPYCHNTLVPILREWMNPPMVTDYICHHCQKGFKIKLKGIEVFL